MTLNFNKLGDKHVLVIGGSSGIGRAVAELSLYSGANVTISSSRQNRIDEVISACKTTYPDRKIAGVAVDLSKPATIEADLERLFSAAVEANGTIHHVVFTAANALSISPLDSVTGESIIQDSHFRMVVPILLAKYAARYLPKERQSSYTITSGVAGDKPSPNWSVTTYFCGGAVALAKGLAVDMAPVRVNCVQPGAVDTPLWDIMGMTADQKKAALADTGKKLLTGKVGQVEDVAEAYLWFMKDGNVTGTVAKTDGGQLLL
jgi:NAD(P)-dependent dehydrogenase (short-subunit alcohol dehydrogenase family)